MEIPNPIVLSAPTHCGYCPRQYALIRIERALSDNVPTKHGNAVHQRVDAPGLMQREGLRLSLLLSQCPAVVADRKLTH
jgi:CRISPR-associated exonuclease Cas4